VEVISHDTIFNFLSRRNLRLANANPASAAPCRMKIHVESPDSGAGQCRTSGDRIQFDIRLNGIDAPQLQALLRGNQTIDWLNLARAKSVSADNHTADPATTNGKLITHEIGDGRFEARSGGHGKVVVENHHKNPISLLPQSLHLLLAQQWARSGILTLHAAAIMTPGGGILVIGPRGGGKSVLTLSALSAGYGVISDDWILLGMNSDNQIQVERLRPFLMIRQSWAAGQLRARLPRLASRPLENRPKDLVRLPENSRRFPIGGSIDQIWLLKRPRSARSKQTRMTPTSQTTALARVVEASMPLLFSKAFPTEHQKLMATIKTLLKIAPVHEVVTGMDIVEEPGKAWQRLEKGSRLKEQGSRKGLEP
jgi:hypothetical protein